jgi:hypothetical protein
MIDRHPVISVIPREYFVMLGSPARLLKHFDGLLALNERTRRVPLKNYVRRRTMLLMKMMSVLEPVGISVKYLHGGVFERIFCEIQLVGCCEGPLVL